MWVMKIVIVSDIHGNPEALKAVPESWDELCALGDLVNYGPNPGEVVDFVRNNAADVVCGNHDYAIDAGVGPRCSPACREMARTTADNTESVLSGEQKACLRHLPPTAQREARGQRFFPCPTSRQPPSARCVSLTDSKSLFSGYRLLEAAVHYLQEWGRDQRRCHRHQHNDCVHMLSDHAN